MMQAVHGSVSKSLTFPISARIVEADVNPMPVMDIAISNLL